MIEYDMAHLKPSYIAAAALYLSMALLDGSKWVRKIAKYDDWHSILSKKYFRLVGGSNHGPLALGASIIPM